MENHFDDAVAARYDAGDPRAEPAHLDLEVGLLASLVPPGGRALELAIGTGRVALPLVERGVEVHGIELSEAMVARLRARPGGADLPVTVGDMATATTGAAYDLVYLVYNTVMNLTTQEAQVACFANAARHLRPGGRFVVETMVSQLQRLAPGERHHVFARSEAHLGLDEYDVASQAMWSHHHHRRDDGTWSARSVPFRWAFPAELDLMARLAGLVLEDRWAWWDRSPYVSDSAAHVSVWRTPDDNEEP
ncbi:class I SAM-dependent methyltransferase [Alteromonas gracilis]